jgi:hypothetical protein
MDRTGPTEGEVTTSYNEVRCIYCGHQPGLLGRLAILIINGHPCWCCLRCETIVMLRNEET